MKFTKIKRLFKKLLNKSLKRTRKYDDLNANSTMLSTICKRASMIFTNEISPESKEMIQHSLRNLPSKMKSCRKENNLSNLSFILLSAANGVEKRFRWSSPLITFEGSADGRNSLESLISVNSVEFERQNTANVVADTVDAKYLKFHTLWKRNDKNLWAWKPKQFADPILKTKTNVSGNVGVIVPLKPNLASTRLRRREKFQESDIKPIKSCLKQSVYTTLFPSIEPSNELETFIPSDNEIHSDAETTLIESDGSIPETFNVEKTRNSLDIHHLLKHDCDDSKTLKPKVLLKSIVKRFSKRTLRREERKMQDYEIDLILERNSGEHKRDFI